MPTVTVKKGLDRVRTGRDKVEKST